jgi:hypothetical protein
LEVCRASQQNAVSERTRGNPAGRPPGARCKATIIAETLLQGEAEALTRSAVSATPAH